MQFCGRFNVKSDKVTLQMCRDLIFEFQDISTERVWMEFWKWATKSIRPSAGLRFLKDCSWVAHFPALDLLINCPQDPEWHPEGDVFEHTCHVVDAAAQIAIRERLSSEDRGILVLAALCHDMGKAITTVKSEGRWKSPAHDKEGVLIVNTFLKFLGAPNWVVDKVCEMTGEHMVHVHAKASARVVRRFIARLKFCSVEEIMRLIESDHSGRPPLPQGLPQTAQEIWDIANNMGQKVEPILMGRHLIEKGIRPGPEMGRILREAFEAQLDGQFLDLEGALQWLNQ